MSLDAWTVMSSLILEDGTAWADAATPAQLTDARAAIEGERPYSYWTRARGAAKTSDAAGVALALLLTAPAGSRLYLAAADQDQAALAHDSIEGYARRSPLLHDLLEIQTRRVVVPTTGATLDVLASDAASSWGLRPHLLIVDEFSAWPDTPGPRRFWESLSSAMAKVPGSRMLLVTSAGDPRSLAFEVLQHARGSDLWRTSEWVGSCPWMSADRLAEQRERLPAPVFAALFMNQWTEAEGSFLDPAAIHRAFTLPEPSAPVEGRQYIGALDLGLTNDRTVLAVGHREGSDIHLDLMMVWRGTKARPVSLGDVRDAIIAAHARYDLRAVHYDKWQAHRLTEELAESGVRTVPFEFTSGSKQRYSGALLQSLNAGTLRLFEPGGLESELAGLTIRTTGSGWAFDHGRRAHDDMSVALALVVLQLSSSPVQRPNYQFSALPRYYTTTESTARRRYLDRHDSTGQFGTRHLDLPPRGAGR